MKKYLLFGLGAIILGAISTVHAEMDATLKDNTVNSALSLKRKRQAVQLPVSGETATLALARRTQMQNWTWQGISVFMGYP